MELGRSKEDYLKTIFMLQKKEGDVYSVNIAQSMGVSKASVSVALKQLRGKGYVEQAQNGGLRLSPQGFSIALQIYERYDFFVKLLLQIGVPLEIARHDACQIEHDISKESYVLLIPMHI